MCFALPACGDAHFALLQMAAHCLMFASLNVLVSTVAFIPLMLYGLNLAEAGWRPVDAALFGAMLGSTDAVAVTAILKAGGAASSSCVS
jgi:NhaP-type Na+/H+ and K+/H+ antiporter